MSDSESQYSGLSFVFGKAFTVATAFEQWLWRFLSRVAAEVEAWAIYHRYESYHGSLQRVLSNKCAVHFRATQMHITYTILVFFVDLLQYVFESQEKNTTIYPASFLGTFGLLLESSLAFSSWILVSFDCAVLCWDEMVANVMPFSAQWYLASHNTKKYTVGQCRATILTVSLTCGCLVFWIALVPLSCQCSADSKCKKGNN